MCLHEESTQPTPATAWQMLDAPDGALHHLYNLDAILNTLRMALEYLNEQSASPSQDMCHIIHMLGMGDEEMKAVYSKLEDLKGEFRDIAA